EKRNFEAILQALSSGQLDVKPLITERVKLENFNEIYGDMRKKGSIASILEFPEDSVQETKVKVTEKTYSSSQGIIGIIGVGNFTSATIIPGMKAANAEIKYIGSAGGLSTYTLAKKGEVESASSDYKEILSDNQVDM